MIHGRFFSISALLLGLCLMGCGSGGPVRVPLKGKVTLDGEPLAKGAILFVPMEGTPGAATGTEIVNGDYSLPSDAGAAPGWNRVEITAMKKSGEKVQDPLGPMGQLIELEVSAVAPRFNSDSELKHEVKAGEDANFQVLSK